jgi:hypothetical protein
VPVEEPVLVSFADVLTYSSNFASGIFASFWARDESL